MQCRSVLTRIDAMRTGELDPRESHKVEEHCDTCPSCNESIDDLQQFAEVIRGLCEDPPASLSGSLVVALSDSFDSFELEGERIWVAFSARGIRMIDVRSADEHAFRNLYRERFARELRPATLPARYKAAVTHAIHGEKVDFREIDLSGLTPFEREVLEAIRRIPRGEVRPYGWVARTVRRPRAGRAVGNVMARNPVPFLLPCHRVVPSDGGIGNYAFGSERKRELLEAEGSPVEDLEALSRGRIRYIGSATTKIFCFPTCSDARRIRDRNRVSFRDEAEAKRLGFRPCKRCTPMAIGA